MQLLGLIMDGLVLLFLAATMVFAYHLSRNIAAFRNSRKELEKLIGELSVQIERADRATTGMKNSAKENGKELQSLIDESRKLADELSLMTDSGDNLASRLERLAERNRDVAERIETRGGKVPAGVPTKEPALQRVQEKKRVPTGPSFAIRDRDVESKSDQTASVVEEIEDDFSKAERELMAALRMGKK